MRKIRSSGNTECRSSFSSTALAWSRPNGFSTTMRPRWFNPTDASDWATVGNIVGGMAM